MDPKILMQINEIYRNEVHGDKELADINQWVSQLISEGYDLDDYSDEELYAAYLSALDEANKGDEYMTSQMFTADKHIKDGKRHRRQKRDFSGVLHPDDWGTQGEPVRQKSHNERRGVKKKGLPEELDLYDIVSEYLVSEGFCDSHEDADVIMANMSEEWRDGILESAEDQSDKQIEKGIKTTYKAGNVLDNRHQGRSRGLNKIDPRERDSKVERMRARLGSRRDDLFKERNKREDEKMEKIRKLLGL